MIYIYVILLSEYIDCNIPKYYFSVSIQFRQNTVLIQYIFLLKYGSDEIFSDILRTPSHLIRQRDLMIFEFLWHDSLYLSVNHSSLAVFGSDRQLQKSHNKK